MGKRVLITGAGGFIGSSVLADLYRRNEYEITALDVGFSKKITDQFPNVHFKIIDITFFNNMSDLFADNNYDFVIHLSGILSKLSEIKDAKFIYDVNVGGTTNVALLAAQYKSKLVFFSTAMVYGDNEGPFREDFKKEPSGYYALSKSIGEDIIIEESKTHHLNFAIFRPSVIYGPAQKGNMFIPSVCDSAINGEEFGMTEGKQKRDFVYIDDVVSAVTLALTNDNVHGIYNLSSGESTLLRDVPSYVQEYIPSFKVEFGKVSYRDGEIWDYSLDNMKLQLEGWSAKTNLKNGIKNVLEYKKGDMK